MSLVNMSDMLAHATRGKYAIASMDVSSSVLLRGVMEVVQELDSPIILAWAPVFERAVPLETYAPMLVAEAERAGVPVCVHLDHAYSLDTVRIALDCGFTSAMFDGSGLPFEENVRLSKEAAQMCHKVDATFEAELGHVGTSTEDGSAIEDESQLTNVGDARRFVAETQVDALAVSIGTVHGVYTSEPHLDLERLCQLREQLTVPLALHSGSGLSDEDSRAVIREGIAKINIYTDLTIAAREALDDAQGSYVAWQEDAIQGVCEAAKKKIRLFGSVHKSL